MMDGFDDLDLPSPEDVMGMSPDEMRLKLAKASLENAKSGETNADLAYEEGAITEQERDEYVRIEQKLWEYKVEDIKSEMEDDEPEFDEDEAVDIGFGDEDDA